MTLLRVEPKISRLPLSQSELRRFCDYAKIRYSDWDSVALNAPWVASKNTREVQAHLIIHMQPGLIAGNFGLPIFDLVMMKLALGNQSLIETKNNALFVMVSEFEGNFLTVEHIIAMNRLYRLIGAIVDGSDEFLFLSKKERGELVLLRREWRGRGKPNIANVDVPKSPDFAIVDDLLRKFAIVRNPDTMEMDDGDLF